MAILTLWITRDGACGLVKVEILEKPTPRIKKVGYTFKGHHRLRNACRHPSRNRSRQGKRRTLGTSGPNEFVRQPLQESVKAYKRLLHDKEQNQLSAQMNSMFGDMMRNAAAAELQQRQLQQRLTGPGR